MFSSRPSKSDGAQWQPQLQSHVGSRSPSKTTMIRRISGSPNPGTLDGNAHDPSHEDLKQGTRVTYRARFPRGTGTPQGCLHRREPSTQTAHSARSIHYSTCAGRASSDACSTDDCSPATRGRCRTRIPQTTGTPQGSLHREEASPPICRPFQSTHPCDNGTPGVSVCGSDVGATSSRESPRIRSPRGTRTPQGSPYRGEASPPICHPFRNYSHPHENLLPGENARNREISPPSSRESPRTRFPRGTGTPQGSLYRGEASPPICRPFQASSRPRDNAQPGANVHTKDVCAPRSQKMPRTGFPRRTGTPQGSLYRKEASALICHPFQHSTHPRGNGPPGPNVLGKVVCPPTSRASPRTRFPHGTGTPQGRLQRIDELPLQPAAHRHCATPNGSSESRMHGGEGSPQAAQRIERSPCPQETGTPPGCRLRREPSVQIPHVVRREMNASEAQVYSSDDCSQASPNNSRTRLPRGIGKLQGYLHKREASPQTPKQAAVQHLQSTNGLGAPPVEAFSGEEASSSLREAFTTRCSRYSREARIVETELDHDFNFLWSDDEDDCGLTFLAHDALTKSCLSPQQRQLGRKGRPQEGLPTNAFADCGLAANTSWTLEVVNPFQIVRIVC